MITIKDRQFKSVVQAHFSGSGGLIVTEDKMVQDLESGITSYEFEIEKTNEKIANIVVGNYVIVNNSDGTTKTLEIIEVDEDNYSKRCYCEDCALDLLGSETGPIDAQKGYTLAHYIQSVLSGTGWELGTVVTPNRKLKLKYESSATIVKRLRQIANAFECEFNYEQVLSEVDQISYRRVNFYKRIGKNENVRLEFGRDILEIQRTETLSKLATTVYATGENGINLDNQKFSEYPYELKNGYLVDVSAVERWKRPLYISNDLGIVKVYESSAKTKERLLQEALRKLKQWSVPEVTYSVKVNNLRLDVGDSVVVIDNNYMPALQLEARVTKVITSNVNALKNSIEISNVINSVETIDDRVADLKRLVSETAKELADANNKLTDFENNVNSNFSDTNNVLSTIEQNLLDKLNNTNNKLTDLEQNITHEIGDTNNVLSTIEQNLLDKLNSTNNKLNNIESDFDKRLESTKNELGQDLTVLENDLGKRITVVKDNLGNTVKVIEGGLNDKISDAKQKFDKQISETKNNFGQTINVLENDLGSKITIVKNELGQTVNVLQGDLTNKIDVVNSNLLGTNDKIDATNNALENAKQDLNSKLTDASNALTDIDNNLADTKQDLDSKINAANNNLENAKQDLDSKINSANNNLADLESNLDTKLENANSKLTDLENNLDTKADLELTQQQLDRINEQSKQLSEELKSKASLEVIRNFELKILENLQSQREISEESKQDLQNLANRVVGIQNNLQDMSAKWTFIDRYVTMAEEGFVIGNADSGSKILINEEKITMQSNGQDVMTIADGMLTINNGVFLTSLQIGYYIESVYESDEFCNVLRYVGPDWQRR